MSVVDEYCECGCHKPGSRTMHVMACCDGLCEHCRRFIKHGRMPQHLQAKHTANKMKELGLPEQYPDDN